MKRQSKENDPTNPWHRFSFRVFSVINADVPSVCDFRTPNDDDDDVDSVPVQPENLSETLEKQRESFVPSKPLCGSSIDEKPESAPSIHLDLDNDQGTSDPGSLQLQNARSNSSHSINKTCGDDTTKLKGNTTSMTQANSVQRGPADSDGSVGAPLIPKTLDSPDLIQATYASSARQKKFHRHFKQVDIDEKVLNYYSCALVGDILLQGHLYITENFFAFYSNVFGYVTKLLIPTVDVLKISKEKTARIIPNAVGISTEDEKHVFGSLLSRDSTYKFMLQVWKAANSSNSAVKMKPPPIIKTELPSDEESSVSSGNEDPSSYISTLTTRTSSEDFQTLIPNIKRRSILMTPLETMQPKPSLKHYKYRTVLIISCAILIFLSASAGYLLHRISIIRNRFEEMSVAGRGFNSKEMYEDILKWQSVLHSTSTSKMHEFLRANINQIAKVRLSLEALSALMFPTTKIEASDQNHEENNANGKENNEKKTE